MGSLQLRATTELLIGARQVPIPVAAVIDRATGSGQTGIEFGLDRGPSDPPVDLQLGDIVGFIEDQLGVTDLAASPGADTVAEALPQVDLSAKSSAQIELRRLSFRSAAAGTSFAISVNLVGATPTDPAIGLPADVAGWLSIRSIGVEFTATANR
jgi:hypothetical protein